MLFHVSEDGGIQRFEPRVSGDGQSLVWAIDADRLRNYLVPRDCPRVTFDAGRGASASDVRQFLGSSAAVVAIEARWFERVRRCQLHVYHFADGGFEPADECAGYFVTRAPVAPVHVEHIHDAIAALLQRDVELRILPELWTLHDAVAASTLQFSMIRMRNAVPRRATPQSPV
ncbi:MAG TPA: hypothetical protein VKE51_14725 [Vicinamibacterales bacterium]|nr:hypothetical protein [Vicinamibacterales bacterium]